MALACFVVALVLGTHRAAACPFCTALEPTLCQRRAGAAVTLLAEVERTTPGGEETLKVHQVLAGDASLQGESRLSVPLDLAAPAGSLLAVFGGDSAEGGSVPWHAVVMDEVSAAYLARAPLDNLPAAERLAYFAKYLEHPNKLIAEDAYLEFGHAAFDQVAEVVPQLSMSGVRGWLTDPAVPGHRKGFYGLLLGLADDPSERRENAALLKQLIVAPEDDFRAGFDGILGGYLLLEGLPGLELVEARYLANPNAAVGDVRHAQTALRFYHEYGHQIAPERICEAMRQLLARPEFAAAAIVDLARWQDWRPLAEIAAMYGQPEYAEPIVRRAVVGYLLNCPEGQAQRFLNDLRARDPVGVSEAENLLSRTGALPQAR